MQLVAIVPGLVSWWTLKPSSRLAVPVQLYQTTACK